MSYQSDTDFYRMLADHLAFPDQWFVSDPESADGEEIDEREFTEGVPYHGPPPVLLTAGNAGRELAFNFGGFDMPVVSTAVAQTIRRIAPNEAEFFPVRIPGSRETYEILNVTCLVDCLDEAISEFTRWRDEDGRPEMMGQYKMIYTIRIELSRTGGHHIFRLAGWPLALIVSDVLRDALADIPDLGVLFEPVVEQS